MVLDPRCSDDSDNSENFDVEEEEDKIFLSGDEVALKDSSTYAITLSDVATRMIIIPDESMQKSSM